MSRTLIHEIQKLHEKGQYLQIVQRLFEFDKLPAGINVSIVIEAISNPFHSSSTNEDEIRQADVLMVRLKLKGYLNRNGLDKIFNIVAEAFLNGKGETPFFLRVGVSEDCPQITKTGDRTDRQFFHYQ